MSAPLTTAMREVHRRPLRQCRLWRDRPTATVITAVVQNSANSPAPRPAKAWSAPLAARRLTSEEKLPSSGVFFTPCQLGARQDAPDGPNDREDGQALPRRVSRHGVDLPGGTHERTDTDVVAELLNQDLARGDRLVTRGVGERLGGDVKPEDKAPTGA